MKKEDRVVATEFKPKKLKKDPKFFQGLSYKDTETEEAIEAKLNKRTVLKEDPTNSGDDFFLSLPIGANGK